MYRLGENVLVQDMKSNLHHDPQIGDIAVMRYEKQGLDHFAYVEIVLDDGIIISECNYHAGECGYRILTFDYAHIDGYFTTK